MAANGTVVAAIAGGLVESLGGGGKLQEWEPDPLSPPAQALVLMAAVAPVDGAGPGTGVSANDGLVGAWAGARLAVLTADDPALPASFHAALPSDRLDAMAEELSDIVEEDADPASSARRLAAYVLGEMPLEQGGWSVSEIVVPTLAHTLASATAMTQLEDMGLLSGHAALVSLDSGEWVDMADLTGREGLIANLEATGPDSLASVLTCLCVVPPRAGQALGRFSGHRLAVVGSRGAHRLPARSDLDRDAEITGLVREAVTSGWLRPSLG